MICLLRLKNVQPPRRKKNIPSLPTKDTIFAQTFFKWLTSIAGGGHPKSQAEQIISHIRKYLCVSNEGLIHDDIKDSDIDVSAGSTEDIGRFLPDHFFNQAVVIYLPTKKTIL